MCAGLWTCSFLGHCSAEQPGPQPDRGSAPAARQLTHAEYGAAGLHGQPGLLSQTDCSSPAGRARQTHCRISHAARPSAQLCCCTCCSCPVPGYSCCASSFESKKACPQSRGESCSWCAEKAEGRCRHGTSSCAWPCRCAVPGHQEPLGGSATAGRRSGSQRSCSRSRAPLWCQHMPLPLSRHPSATCIGRAARCSCAPQHQPPSSSTGSTGGRCQPS